MNPRRRRSTTTCASRSRCASSASAWPSMPSRGRRRQAALERRVARGAGHDPRAGVSAPTRRRRAADGSRAPRANSNKTFQQLGTPTVDAAEELAEIEAIYLEKLK
eukprot:3962558-Pleurochrysis_carterae.AAC.1